MPEEQTNFTSGQNGDSKVMGVSIRGWISLILTFTVCIISIQAILFALARVTNIPQIKVEEPLYSAFLISLGFYFGKQTIK